MISSGLKRIDKELEVDRFLKTQIKFRVAMKALFSKIELFLIQNNKRFVLNSQFKHSKEIRGLKEKQIE